MPRFLPKNKSLYKGKCGRRLYSHTGYECVVHATMHIPAEHAKDRKPFDLLVISFPKAFNSSLKYNVRPCDVE